MNQVRYDIKGTGFSFEMPDPVNAAAIDTSAHSVSTFNAARFSLDSLAIAKQEVDADANLSSVGKQKKIAPRHEATWEMVALTYEKIDELEAELVDRTAVLESIPRLHDSASAVAVEDREARDWWRSQSVQGRSKILEQIANDEAAHKKYERLQLALLRSPIPLPDAEVATIRHLWQQLKRIENPAEAQAIDQGYRTVEWVRRGAAHLQAIATQMTGWDKGKLANFLQADEKRQKVARHLEVTPQQMEAARNRALSAKSRTA